MFNHGIMINYNSTDESANIIKSICPNWEIINSRNPFFEAKPVDEEIEDIERSLDGWRICLNITEFLIGDTSIINNDTGRTSYKIPAMVMVDVEPEKQIDISMSLFKQKYHGIDYNEGFRIRRARNLHCDKFISYPLGRHYENFDTNEFLILWYGWSPYNQQIKRRKIQIGEKMSPSDKIKGFSVENQLTEELMDQTYRTTYLPRARDLTEDLKRFNLE
jgi:hypothetical protein